MVYMFSTSFPALVKASPRKVRCSSDVYQGRINQPTAIAKQQPIMMSTTLAFHISQSELCLQGKEKMCLAAPIAKALSQEASTH